MSPHSTWRKSGLTRIMLIGSFGGYNWGDNLVLHSIIDILQTQIGKENLIIFIPTVNSGNVERILGKQSHIKPIDMNLRNFKGLRFLNYEIIKAFRSCDYVFTTAGILFARDFLNLKKNLLSTFYIISKIFKHPSTVIVGFGVGITKGATPFQNKIMREIIALHKVIITRDDFSGHRVYDIMQSNEVPIISKSDVLHYKFKKFVSESDLVTDNMCIGINLCSYFNAQTEEIDSNEVAFFDEMSLLVKFLQSERYNIVFVSTTPYDKAYTDIYLSNYGLTDFHNIPLYDLDFEASLKQYKQFKFFIGTRLHSCLFSTSCLIPTLALNYNNKVGEYFKDIQMEENVLSFSEFKADIVIGKLELLKSNYSQIQRHLREQMQARVNAFDNWMELLK